MSNDSVDLGQIIERTRKLLESLEQSRALNDAAQAAERQTRSRLASLLRLAKADTVIADIEPEDLVRFVARPHLIRQLGHGKRWEVLVPKMFKLNDVGWPVREEGEYMVYLVSPFVGAIMPISPVVREMIPGLEAPDFAAHVEGFDLIVDDGDPDEVYQKVGGKKAVAEHKGRRLRLKAQARFNVCCDLIRMGVLPWAPNPVPAALRRQPKVNFELRDYQAADYKTFLEYSAMGLFAYGGTGKTFFGIRAMAEMTGPKVVFAPTTILLDQWKRRLELHAPHLLDETTFLTYASLEKAMGKEWSLAIFDEVHRLVATTYLQAAYIKTAARIGMSATPVRLDGREDLIAALCGVPAGVNWPITEMAKPAVTVWVVRNEAERFRKARELAQIPHGGGKVLIYADHIKIGQDIADSLGVPFVYSKTKAPLDVVRDHAIVVLSRIGDLGLSFEVDRIIQVDYAGRSQAQEGQRALRAGHEVDTKTQQTEMHILATPDQWKRFVQERTAVYRRWGIDVDVRVTGSVSEEDALGARPKFAPSRAKPSRQRGSAEPSPRVQAAKTQAAGSAVTVGPSVEIEEAWSLPGIQAKVAETKKLTRPHAWPYIMLLFELCFQAPFSLEELFLLKGITNESTKSRYRTISEAMLQTGLLIDAGEQRFKTNHVLIDQIRALSSRRA